VYESVAELDILVYDYLLHREKRMEEQWNTKHDSLGEVLDGLAEEEGLKSIRADYATLGDVFSQVTTDYKERQKLIQEGASQEKIDAATGLEERLVTQLLIISHSIITDASRLAEEAHTEATEAQRVASNLTVVLMIVLAIAITTSSLLIARSISKPLTRLADYSRRVGEGEYTADIEIKGKDEVASVASDVKSMVGQLLATGKELRESEEQSRILMEQSPIGIQIMNLDGRIVQVNDAYVTLWGVTLEDLSEYNILRDEQVKSLGLMPYIERAFAGEAALLPQSEYELLKTVEKGAKRWVQSYIYPVKKENGEIRNVVMLHQDITGLKKAEKELKKHHEHLEALVEERTRELRDAQEGLVRSERLATLGQFSGNISHELRNPLGVIDSSAYYLKSKLKGLDEKTLEHLDRIKSSVSSSTAIIESLLNLTRMKEPQFEKLDLTAVTSDAIDTSKIPASVKVVKDFPEQEVTVNADGEQLRMAFKNIVKNAVQAMDGEGTLTVTVRRSSDSQAEVSFADTGAGIAPENLSMVFTPLFSTKAKGIGFGLSIVKMIIDKHGGMVTAEPERGKGAAIIIRLPLYSGENKEGISND